MKPRSTRRHETIRPGLVVLYGALAMIGAGLPLSAFLPWATLHGLDVPLFAGLQLVNPISPFFMWDVMVSALVPTFVVAIEGRKMRGR